MPWRSNNHPHGPPNWTNLVYCTCTWKFLGCCVMWGGKDWVRGRKKRPGVEVTLFIQIQYRNVGKKVRLHPQITISRWYKPFLHGLFSDIVLPTLPRKVIMTIILKRDPTCWSEDWVPLRENLIKYSPQPEGLQRASYVFGIWNLGQTEKGMGLNTLSYSGTKN